MKYYVEIVEHGTGRVEKRIGPIGSDRAAGKVEDGANINLNHERFFTRTVSEESPQEST